MCTHFHLTKLNSIKVIFAKDLKKKRKSCSCKPRLAQVPDELTARTQVLLVPRHSQTQLPANESHLHQGIFSEI